MENRCLVIRYGELFLKGKNRNDFIQKLVDNVNLVYKKNDFSDFQIKKLSDRLIITTKTDKELVKMLLPLENIFGISIFYLAYQLESNLEKLKDFVRKITNYYKINLTTFKFDISRSYKKFSKTSLDLQKELGKIIVEKHNLKVNLSDPQTTFYIRIYHNYILFYNEKRKGLGGLPVGSSGKALLLLSGGIDSAVAAYQLMKRGLEIVYCHFYYQKEGQEKLFLLGEKLKAYNNYANSNYLINYQPLINEIRHISQESYRLIILKRMFIRYACLLAYQLKIKALATGDSLAQVASQTLESLTVVQQVSSLLILQPLISWDKKEIITKAQKIGTYEISIRNYQDCCHLFESRYPVTKPKKEIAEKLEKKILWQISLNAICQKTGINYPEND